MRVFNPTKMFIHGLLILMSASAFANEGISVTISNNTTRDLVVTVYDLNTNPVQTAQTAVCNRHHCVDQQLCRWLLLSLDRLSSNRLTMTQDLIADMLGVRREGISKGPASCRRSA